MLAAVDFLAGCSAAARCKAMAAREDCQAAADKAAGPAAKVLRTRPVAAFRARAHKVAKAVKVVMAGPVARDRAAASRVRVPVVMVKGMRAADFLVKAAQRVKAARVAMRVRVVADPEVWAVLPVKAALVVLPAKTFPVDLLAKAESEAQAVSPGTARRGGSAGKAHRGAKVSQEVADFYLMAGSVAADRA